MNCNFYRVIVPNWPLSSSSLHLLKQLQWLPVELHIKFKIATLMFKVLETGQPPYLAQQLCAYAPTRALRSSTSKLLQVPRTNLQFGSLSFRVSAPTLWNSLPHSVRFCESPKTSRKHLKTFYFQSAFSVAPQLPTTVWLGGVVVRAPDSRSADCGFDSRPRHCRATTLGKLFTPMCLCLPSSISWYLVRAFMSTRRMWQPMAWVQ